MISDALTDVPQKESLKIKFWFPKFLQLYAKDRSPSGAYEVLRASYSGPMHMFSPAKWMIEQGCYDAEWAIEVHPVPRASKHGIHGKLISEALPKLREWLIRYNHFSNREGFHALTFSFDKTKNELTWQELTSCEWKTQKL